MNSDEDLRYKLVFLHHPQIIMSRNYAELNQWKKDIHYADVEVLYIFPRDACSHSIYSFSVSVVFLSFKVYVNRYNFFSI